ncbi:MAG: hypothetical protein LKI94_12690 [Sporolactobacillus sp.]|nr:hypothetical protein [Sporolactobacillus sp.]
MKHRIRRLSLLQISYAKLYNYLIAMTLLIPLIYGAFILLNMARSGKNFQSLLMSRPLYSAMFMSMMLDLLWGYLLYQLKKESKGEMFTYCALFLLAICQFLISNFVIAIMTIFVMMYSDTRLKDCVSLHIFWRNRLYTAMLAGLVILSFLCSFAIVRLIFFA